MNYKDKKTIVTITMDFDVWKETKDLSYKNNTSLSALINKLLKNYIKERKKEI